MKTVKKNVYYCDFCNKRGFSSGHMRAHEKHCTANPNRICRVCDGQFEFLELIKDFKSRYKIVESDVDSPMVTETIEWIGKEITMEEIDNHVDDCPACKLAVMRQSGLTSHSFHETLKYDYPEAHATY